ncbi:MAG: hypothetical protein KAU31_00205, partial [Spirochaetaceae bacterium]|nr:hypothetical protein [Spirochaetaceae bacterium]
RLTISRGGMRVASRRLTYLRPPSMIRYELRESAWAALRRHTGPITVAVEVAAGMETPDDQ